MRNNRHIIPCGGLKAGVGVAAEAVVLPLNLWSKLDTNYVELQVEDLHAALFQTVPDEFHDLMEIAAYVYCADQATSRGGKDVDGFGEHWRRQFEFKIPVRVPDFWNQTGVQKLLTETLGFLSDDDYFFEFEQAVNPPPIQEYFSDLLPGGPAEDMEGVVLFSGGLDSVAGAVEEAVGDKRRVMLVTHKPTDKLNNVHKRIKNLLAQHAGQFRPQHLYVRAHKSSDLNKNYTQRTRSFLYACVGATVSRMMGFDRLRFYENGVVSLNLPVCAQVVGSRATRTTHPAVLAGFENLFTVLAGAQFHVENKFIWDTKADVIRRLVKHGCGDLIGASISCAHVFTYSNQHPHCGTCSQCIDRRIGIIAAGAEQFERADGYKYDVFTGHRPKEEDRMMVGTYLNRAERISKLGSVADLITAFPDVVRAFKHIKNEGKPLAVAEKVFVLHQRHAAEVNGVLERMIGYHAKQLREHSLDKDCLLSLTYDSGGATAPVVVEKPTIERQTKRWDEEKEAKNVFRLWRGYKWWNLVYAGERDVLPDDRAVNLVEYLLKHPADEAIHAIQLENLVDGEPLLDGWGGIGQAEENGNVPVAVGSVGGVVQEASGRKLAGKDTLPALRAEYIELRATVDDETLPGEEREAAQEKLSALAKASSQGGKFVDQASRAADRVRKQIKALIKELMEAEKSRGTPNEVLRAFGKHLEDHLWLPSVGMKNRIGATGKPGCYTYDPPDDVRWRG
jgi:7-cyano-7-deazaguanine synthase in queuosine biosynthesis